MERRGKESTRFLLHAESALALHIRYDMVKRVYSLSLPSSPAPHAHTFSSLASVGLHSWYFSFFSFCPSSYREENHLHFKQIGLVDVGVRDQQR